MTKPKKYNRLDSETMREIGKCVESIVRAEHSSPVNTTAEDCRKKTRLMLERVRDGTATDAERKLIAWGMKQMSGETDYALQTYALTLRYFTPERLKAEEIASVIFVDRSHVYRVINFAIERLSIWLFGADALDWQ
jgi:hypothetical protein